MQVEFKAPQQTPPPLGYFLSEGSLIFIRATQHNLTPDSHVR